MAEILQPLFREIFQPPIQSFASALSTGGGSGPVELAVVAMANGLTTSGDSLTAGSNVPAGEKGWVKRSESLTGGAPDLALPGLLEDTLSGTFTNLGVGGTRTTAIVDTFLTTSGANKARNVNVWAGRNDVPQESTLADMPTWVSTELSRLVAGIGHSRYAFFGVTNGPASSEARLFERWARVVLTNRKLQRDFAGRVINIRRLLLAAGTGTGQDATDAALDVIPLSLHPSAGDYVHFNQLGNVVVAAVVDRIVRALEGYKPYVVPFHETHLAGSAAATAQTNGGAVAQAYAFGTVTSWALLDNNTDFAINPSTGAISRASATVLRAQWYDLTIQATNSYGSSTGVLRVYLGLETGTAFYPTALAGTGALCRPLRDTSIVDGSRLSFALRVRPSGAGTTRILRSSTTSRIVGQLLTSNLWNFIGRNASNTIIANITAKAGLTHPAGTWGWLYVTVDLNTPSVSLGLELDGNAADFTSPSTTATSAGSLNLTAMPLIGAGNPSNSVPGIATPFTGDVAQYIEFPGVAIDWSNSANRDLIRDATTRLPLAPSTVLGNTPAFDFRGTPADWAYGKHFGSVGDFASFVPATGAFA